MTVDPATPTAEQIADALAAVRRHLSHDRADILAAALSSARAEAAGLRAEVDKRDAAQAQVQAVEALHRPHPFQAWCMNCGQSPCTTRAALAAAQPTKETE